MCTKQYLVLRKRKVLHLIQQTVNLAVDGAEDRNGGCFGGKLEEMRYVILTLHAQADHLGIILARIEGLTDSEGEEKAVRTIGNLIAKIVGEVPPDDILRSFVDPDPTMN